MLVERKQADRAVVESWRRGCQMERTAQPVKVSKMQPRTKGVQRHGSTTVTGYLADLTE